MHDVLPHSHMCPGDRYVIPDGADEDSWIHPRAIDTLVFDAIAAATDTDPAALDPLAEYVDQAALASVFDDTDGATECSFTVEAYDVTVHRSGDVDVQGP
ncbi:HalOD1 output domain-containing protein [Halorhabdus sp. CBA1104]|uniref:HalOD1 output domain-containing protein n=1 Tax=Halorhabdus sp. CBA1104 TaxID=1380432 RepID=UPI001E47F610|nr:HalOD1 output domain-containing protein [Halorhabdus sp. CBA1104]